MLRVATVFSGIGAIEHALKRSNIDHEIVFACDNGDVDILSKEINNDLQEMNSEIFMLKKLIVEIKAVTDEDIKNKNNLLNSLTKSSNELLDKTTLLNCINEDLTQTCIVAIKKILKNKEVKKVRVKELSDYLKKLQLEESLNRIFNSIKCAVKIISEYLKDNELSNLNKDQFVFKNKDNILWVDVIEDLMQLNKIAESNNFKKIIKEFKMIAENLSMLHERINTLHISKNIECIKSCDEKKKYIDSLYESKKNHNKVRQSYLANYDIDEADFHWNVSFLDGEKYKNKVDLFVGGSPCQSFSLVGKQRGLDDTRGTLFYEFARLVNEVQPKVFIYENVKAVLSNDNGRTWETMAQVFTDLNYVWTKMVLNAKNFGIPQNRERVFVVGFKKDIKLEKDFRIPESIELDKFLQDFLIDNVSGKYYLPEKGVEFVTNPKNLTKRYTQIDGEVQLCQKKNQQFNWHGDFVFVEENKNMEKTMEDLEKYFLSEKVEKYVMSTGTKGFYSKPKVDLEVARPLLTTMHKMHRAGVDNYVTTKGRLRKLTPRECLRLMGFCDSFKIVVSDTSMYQQAGNSIVVDVLIAIMKKVVDSYPKIISEE